MCFCVKGGRDRNSALCVEAEKRRFLSGRLLYMIEPQAQLSRLSSPAARLLRTTLVLALVATFCVGAVFATGLNKTAIMREAGAPVCMREASSVAEAAKCLSRARVS